MASKLLQKNKKLVIANWKMNPDTLRDARGIFNDLKKKGLKIRKSVPVICPPVLFLADLATNYRGNLFEFGAQNVSWVKKKESTGEISTDMLKEVGARLVIVGHSEKRAVGETNTEISLKIRKTVAAGMTPVLCIGELERDDGGEYLRFVEEQLHDSLSGVTKKEIDKVVIAYEPVWTIGKGKKAIAGDDLLRMVIFIKKILSHIYNRKLAMDIPVIYGGSVDEENCQEILDTGLDGLLVGRASLNPHTFADILKKIG